MQYTKVAVANHSMLQEKRPHRARQVSFADEFSVRQVQEKQQETPQYQQAFSKIIGMLRKLENKLSSNAPSTHQQTPPSSPDRGNTSSKISSPSRARCFRCNVIGHFAKNCPESRLSPSRSSQPLNDKELIQKAIHQLQYDKKAYYNRWIPVSIKIRHQLVMELEKYKNRFYWI